MKSRFFLVLCMLLSACKPDNVVPVDTAASPLPSDASAISVSTENATDASTTSATDTRDSVSSTGLASFAGYGDMKLGSSKAAAKAAWGGELVGEVAAGSRCHYLSPKWVGAPAEFAFMFDDDRFVRYDVGTAKEAAPGGGKVGMSLDQLQALYMNALQASPHKYVSGAQVLSLQASGVAPAKLVFETDAQGKVSHWRVGLLPQVDYVEGCS